LQYFLSDKPENPDPGSGPDPDRPDQKKIISHAKTNKLKIE